MNPQKQIQKYIYKNNLNYFIQRSFYIINQGVEYMHNWHIDAISEALNEVNKGNVKRLIINMPPRYLKSVCVSVAFPAWVLGNYPYKRIIVASYSEKLSLKHSTDCRLIMESDWFKNIFDECILSKNQNEKYKFSTTQNGYRFATSVNGTLTGEGGDILIVDDPHNPQNVLSKTYREKTINWFSNTFISRLNSKKNGAIIVVMQRLHEEDLSGVLIKKGNWDVLNLPAIAENDEEIKIGNFYKKRLKGEVLFEKRENIDDLAKMKNEMGTYVFNAQYQQKPMAKGSDIIDINWIKRFDNTQKICFENIYLSFDTAIKIANNNDPTVCCVFGEKNNEYYLINVIRKWLEYPELKKETLNLVRKYNPIAVLIEDKASGQSLIQDLKRETRFNIIAIKVNKDKLTRFASITPIIEAGRLYLPEKADWLFDLENELLLFPNSAHDDQVDAISQFLKWKQNNNIKRRELTLRRI